jgi:hypothetical protein
MAYALIQALRAPLIFLESEIALAANVPAFLLTGGA